jgi:hypothetical protein
VDDPSEIVVLRGLVSSFPVPDGRWHGFSNHIEACRDDFAAAVEAVAADEAALEALQAALGDGPTPRRTAEPAVTDAEARLAALPSPEGRHPFVEEIYPALEAMQAVLAAVAASPTAASGFAARRRPGEETL